MRLYKQGNNIYVKVGDDEMLCVGTQAEVDAAAAAEKKLSDLINLAWAIHRYDSIDWRLARRH